MLLNANEETFQNSMIFFKGFIPFLFQNYTVSIMRLLGNNVRFGVNRYPLTLQFSIFYEFF